MDDSSIEATCEEDAYNHPKWYLSIDHVISSGIAKRRACQSARFLHACVCECSFAFPPFNNSTTMSKQSSLLSFFGSKRQKVKAQFTRLGCHYRSTLLSNRLHHLRLSLLLQRLPPIRLLALLLPSVKKEIWTTLLHQQKTTMTNWIHRLRLVGYILLLLLLTTEF